MASLGKINPSIIAVPNELTVAAAAFNIDFSLLKIEAPPSFHGVRDALTHWRQSEAEAGIPHMTARRLGALFDAKVPPIQHLIEAYGSRASEICSKLEDDSKYRPDIGIFKMQAGPDGTNIWASATSGSGALAAHLLACMLARIWKSHEAISLWVELVERRKQEIKIAFNDGGPTMLAAAMAAQQVITREHLAAWDASARSWLRTADSAQRLQQTQLTLILNNLCAPVNSNSDPYESIMQAWITAMKTMERMVQGESQRIMDGSVLLAISSWHLYPNMEVLLSQVKEIDQHDELMHGAVITVSQQGSGPGRKGVFWSLPLSRMRYYNAPEVQERHIASDTSRVTIQELWIVILGAITGPWCGTDSGAERAACEFINFLGNYLDSAKYSISWLSYLSKAAYTYLHTAGLEKKLAVQLLALGRRRGKTFLSRYESTLPQLFDLVDFSVLLSIVEGSSISPGLGSSNQIDVLRSFAGNLECSPQDLLIRYFTQPYRDATIPAQAYTTAIPWSRNLAKRTSSSQTKPALGHVRWLVAAIEAPDMACESKYCSCMSTPESNIDCCCKRRCTEYCHPTQPVCSNFSSLIKFECVERGEKTVKPSGHELPADHKLSRHLQEVTKVFSEPFSNVFESTHYVASGDKKKKELDTCLKNPCRGCYNRSIKNNVEMEGEACEFILPGDIEESMDQFTILDPNSGEAMEFEYLIGDLKAVALFKRKGTHISRKQLSQEADSAGKARKGTANYFSPNCVATQDEVHTIFKHPAFSPRRLSEHLRSFNSSTPTVAKSLSALEFASSVYEMLEGATINLEILALSLSDAHWAFETPWDSKLTGYDTHNTVCELSSSSNTPVPSVQHQGNSSFYRLERAFSCLSMFESGYFDMNPSSLRAVFALSSGNSIFVASGLIADPATPISSRPVIRRVFGNIGRPGMAFLISPAEPRLKKCDLKSWHLVNHLPFDRKFQNSFTGTSLHLSFTEFEMPIDVGFRGLKDTPASLVESLITLDEKGQQLGDLDIWPIVSRGPFKVLKSCQHTNTDVDGTRDELDDSSSNYGPILEGMVSIDCWDELFDFPDQKAIFRATGNWQARIAGLTASLQLGKKVLVFPETPCLKCLSEIVSLEETDIIIA